MALQLRRSSCVDHVRSGAAVRCKRRNRKKDGTMGFRRARTAFGWLVFHRYSNCGVYYGNTLKSLFFGTDFIA